MIPGLKKSPGEGNGNPVLLPGRSHEDLEAWQDIVHGVSKTQIRLGTHEHPDLVTLLSGDIEHVDG